MATFTGTSGSDTLTGGVDGDLLTGAAGNDILAGGAGNDTVDGGNGNDTVRFTGEFSDYAISYDTGVDSGTETYVIVDGVANRDGTDQVQWAEYFWFSDGLRTAYEMRAVNGTAGNDSITGTYFSEAINGLAGNDTLLGGQGNDSLNGGAGNDLLNGGDGIDTATYTGTSGAVTVNLSLAGAQATGGAGTDTLIAIENLTGGEGGDTLTGNADVNRIAGGLGNDVLHGVGNYDTLLGGGGNDTLDGGYVMAGGAGSDLLTGGAGDDSIYSDSVSPAFSRPYYDYIPAELPLLDTGSEKDTLAGGAGDDDLFAGYGDDVDGGTQMYWGNVLYISFQGATSGVYADFRLLNSQPSITIGGGTITHIQQIGWLQGSEYDDFLAPLDSYYSNFEPVYGMGGNDHIVASYYTGLIDGGAGNDSLEGNGGYGFPVYGGPGDDTINGSGNLHGGDGNDRIQGSSGSTGRLFGDAGDDTLLGSPYAYGASIEGGDGNDSIVGAQSSESLYGGQGNDTITAGSGNDTLDGGAGVDTGIWSGNFADYAITYDSDARLVTVADTQLYRDGSDRVTGIEFFQFGDETRSAADATGIGIIDGTDGADSLTGTGGRDAIYAAEADDTVGGGGGNDSLYGGVGNDTVVLAGNFADYAVSYQTSSASFLFSDSVDGRDGTDRIREFESFAFADGTMAVSQLHLTIEGTAGNDLLGGLGGSDVISGLAGNDTLNGTDGDDSLDGGAGADSLAGNGANDLLTGGAGSDALDGGAGGDTAVFSGALAEYAVAYNSAASTYYVVDTVEGRDGVDTIKNVEFLQFADGLRAVADAVNSAALFGTSGNDSVTGTSGADVVHGLGGYDTLAGGNGDDLLRGWEGNDSLLGGAGNDTLYGDEGSDVLAGSAGCDLLVGGDGDEWIFSDAASSSTFAYWDRSAAPSLLDRGAEKDTVLGGAGDDTLFAGYGDDVDGGARQSWGNYLYISFQGATSGVHADFRLLYTQPSITVGGGTIANIQEVAYIQGSEYDDFLAPIDSYYSNFEPVYGMGGNDEIIAAYYTGVIDGGEGNDLVDARGAAYGFAVYGGVGDDTIRQGSGGVFGGEGDDLIYAANGAIDGEAGTDTAVFSSNMSWYSIVYYPSTSSFSVGNCVLRDVEFMQFADVTIAADDYRPGSVINGTASNDLLTGGSSNDTLFGGAGDDTLDGGRGPDLLSGDDGTDTARYGSATGAVTVSLATNLATGGAGNDTLSSVENVVGGSYADSIAGNSGVNRLEGAAGNDTIDGASGNDTLAGGSGDDSLVGNSGEDRAVFQGNLSDYSVTYESGSATFVLTDGVSSRDGTDRVKSVELFQFADGTRTAEQIKPPLLIVGTSGNDSLAGGTYPDTLSGAQGNDSINGNGGNDQLQGDAGNDSLSGSDGDDTLTGGAGNDSLYGGKGADVAVFSGNFNDYDTSANGSAYLVADSVGGRDASDWVSEVEYFQFADRTVTAAQLLAGETLTGGSDSDLLAGSRRGDSLHGGAGEDTLNGALGNDTLEGGADNDSLQGDAGSDIAVFSGNYADYSFTYESDSATYVVVDGVGGRDGTDRLQGVESFQFADGVRAASQTVPNFGTEGNDVLNGTDGSETMYGLGGNDGLYGGKGSDTLCGGAGNDTLNGGDGADTASYAGSAAGVKVSLLVTNAQSTGGAGTDLLVGIENLMGGDGSDTLTGSAIGNRLEGGLGNDTLDGGLGTDTLLGGAGNDTYTVDNAGDVVTELANEGIDTVNALASFTLAANFENLVLGGKLVINGAGNELDNVITGNGGVNILTGHAGNDTLNGGAGNDQLMGGEGNDVYFVDAALDTITEGADAGNDTVNALVDYTLGADLENLVLVTGGKAKVGTGNALDNHITGNAAANTLNAAAGNDILDGKAGADVLTGGVGNDTFVFSTALAKNIDKITDFNASADTIQLDNAIFTTLGEGLLSASAFQAAASSVAATLDARIIFNTSSGALFYDADGSGVLKAVQFATIVLTGLAGPVTADDFVVI
ncbi:MAG: hypothetical protein ACAH21_01675 [Ramlibacter sp.]